MKYLATTAAILALAMVPLQSHAQSTEEVLGAVIGGTSGAIVGGELDKKGSKTEGRIIGAAVGGSLGYIVGDRIDDNNDRDRIYRDRYANTAGEYYQQDGRAYRRYRDTDGFVSFPVRDDDPFYYVDGRAKPHPVHGTNPGKGRGKGRYKR